ncbi:DUF1592 domain-containing protein [Telmatocola sphagniphila]|uniref:DUF1592 domain-containing protein n=1 Tax=Telmatocola sphagniphila TaxID=1123043 RepID=A0A8E6BBQ8_9BACT|nr:DUF1592 domain-containing protein [Telmatocola sphagniphila]
MCRYTLPAIFTLSLLICAPSSLRAAEEKTGEAIYKKQCASCHGANGEGTKKYPEQLIGNRSVAQLAKYISKSMPEDNPGSCTGADADNVAAYMYEAFYSNEARERNKPPRIELARLTVRQYRNSVADLIDSFRGSAPWGDKRGLRGEYFNARDPRNDKRILDRLDPEVNFDFRTESPVPDKIEKVEFCVNWSGSILAPETGDYTFTVKTENAMQLFVNQPQKPLIDILVKSGNDTEYKGNIYLVAGRVYPIRLLLMKGKQGVDDKKKDRPPQRSNVTLEWTRPKGTSEVIPSRFLSPSYSAESYVVSNPFPPDDRSYGWERGTSISKEWDQAATDAALDAAGFVSTHLNELARTRDGAKERDKAIRDFCLKFVERAFRRPLDDDQKKAYIDHQFEIGKTPEVAVKRMVLFVLKSPRFLYREVGNHPDAYDTASRLSYGLWDSLPDQELLNAASQGRLKNRDQVAQQADRMLKDPRAQQKVREFLFHWLKLDQSPDISKDQQRFPGFDTAVVADLKSSLEMFLDDVAWSSSSNFKDLLLSEALYLNDRLARFYEAPLPAEPQFRKIQFPNSDRAGVLTHPYMMSAYSYTSESSPIHRGVFLVRGMLGITLRPPAVAITPVNANLHPDLTTRERVTLQTKPQNCTTCHGIINPLGFTLENFDAIGRFRNKDNGKPVDAHGMYLTRSGEQKTFNGVRDLAKFLADSEEVYASFADQMFHHLVQQSIGAYGPDKSKQLKKAFIDGGLNIRKLAIEVMANSALTSREDKVTINQSNKNEKGK